MEGFKILIVGNVAKQVLSFSLNTNFGIQHFDCIGTHYTTLDSDRLQGVSGIIVLPCPNSVDIKTVVNKDIPMAICTENIFHHKYRNLKQYNHLKHKPRCQYFNFQDEDFSPEKPIEFLLQYIMQTDNLVIAPVEYHWAIILEELQSLKIKD